MKNENMKFRFTLNQFKPVYLKKTYWRPDYQNCRSFYQKNPEVFAADCRFSVHKNLTESEFAINPTSVLHSTVSF